MSRPVQATTNQQVPLPASHDCAGCPTRLTGHVIACDRCLRRLPRNLRHDLKFAERVRHRDHVPINDVIKAMRAWLADNRIET